MQPSLRHRLLGGAAFGAAVAATAVVGARAGPRNNETQRWFDHLEKPPFQPPDAVFGPVWSTLYPAIAFAGWRIWDQPPSPRRTRALRWWTAQMATNAAWTPVFFGLKKPRAALVILATQLVATAATTATATRIDRTAGLVLTPYFAWSAFAFALNEEIVRRN